MTVYSGLGRDRCASEPVLVFRDLLVRLLAFGLLTVFGLAFVTGGEALDQAALQPILFFTAPVAALYLYPLMNVKAHRKALSLAASIAVIVLLVTPAHYSFSHNATIEKDVSTIQRDMGVIEVNKIDRISPVVSLR